MLPALTACSQSALACSRPCVHRPRGPPAGPKAPSGPERSTLAARMPRRRLWWSSGAWADLTAFGHAGLPATSSLVHCSAAALAGGLTDVMTNPLWLVRTRMATSRMRAEVDGAKAAAGEAVVAGSVVAGRMAVGRVGGAAAKEYFASTTKISDPAIV